MAGFVAGVPLGAEAAVAVPDRPMRAAFGALLGSRVAGRVDGRRLGRIFAVVGTGRGDEVFCLPVAAAAVERRAGIDLEAGWRF